MSNLSYMSKVVERAVAIQLQYSTRYQWFSSALPQCYIHSTHLCVWSDILTAVDTRQVTLLGLRNCQLLRLCRRWFSAATHAVQFRSGRIPRNKLPTVHVTCLCLGHCCWSPVHKVLFKAFTTGRVVLPRDRKARHSPVSVTDDSQVHIECNITVSNTAAVVQRLPDA